MHNMFAAEARCNVDNHLDNSPLLDLCNLCATFLRLGENMEPLLSTGWVCLKALIANLDHLQQSYFCFSIISKTYHHRFRHNSGQALELAYKASSSSRHLE